MLPHWISGFIGMLPFQFAYYVPLSIINGNITTAQAVDLMPLALFWMALLIGMAYLYWRHTKNHLDAVGV